MNDNVHKKIDGMGKFWFVNFRGLFSLLIEFLELSCLISSKFLGLLLGLMLIRCEEYVVEGNLGKANFCRVKSCAIREWWLKNQSKFCSKNWRFVIIRWQDGKKLIILQSLLVIFDNNGHVSALLNIP